MVGTLNFSPQEINRWRTNGVGLFVFGPVAVVHQLGQTRGKEFRPTSPSKKLKKKFNLSPLDLGSRLYAKLYPGPGGQWFGLC
jgi:hypothetical protein